MLPDDQRSLLMAEGFPQLVQFGQWQDDPIPYNGGGNGNKGVEKEGPGSDAEVSKVLRNHQRQVKGAKGSCRVECATD